MRCVVLSGRSMSKEEIGRLLSILSKEDLVISADSGYQNALAAGILPQIAVGDFDSFDAGEIDPGVKIIRHPAEKDCTDTHLAIETGFAHGCREFFLFGATGGRFDHTYANICLLDLILEKGGQGRVIEKDGEISLHAAPFLLEGKKRCTVSFLPFDGDVSGVTLTGFYYPLQAYHMRAKEPIGISNIVVSNKARVDFEKGKLFSYISYKDN